MKWANMDVQTRTWNRPLDVNIFPVHWSQPGTREARSSRLSAAFSVTDVGGGGRRTGGLDRCTDRLQAKTVGLASCWLLAHRPVTDLPCLIPVSALQMSNIFFFLYWPLPFFLFLLWHVTANESLWHVTSRGPPCSLGFRDVGKAAQAGG